MAEAYNPTALIDKDRTESKIKRTEKSETPSLSGLPEHRNLERVYHEVDAGKKKELAQKILDETKAKLADKFPKDIAEIPELKKEGFLRMKNTSMTDIPETDKPQIFKQKVEGTENDYRVYVRLNNGRPNSVVIIDTRPDDAGKISFDISKERGFFHLTTNDKLEEARMSRFPIFNKSARSLEGRWMRGDITSSTYRIESTKDRKKSPDEFWKENDKKRVSGILKWGEMRVNSREQANYAVREWISDKTHRKIDAIWEKEDKAKEEWDRKVEAAKATTMRRLRYVQNFIQNDLPDHIARHVKLDIDTSNFLGEVPVEEDTKDEKAATTTAPVATATPTPKPKATSRKSTVNVKIKPKRVRKTVSSSKARA